MIKFGIYFGELEPAYHQRMAVEGSGLEINGNPLTNGL